MSDNKNKTMIGSRLGKVIESFPSKTTAAKAAGITLQQLNKWIKGEAKIPIEGLMAISNSKYSNKNLLWLATGNAFTNTHEHSIDIDFVPMNLNKNKLFKIELKF